MKTFSSMYNSGYSIIFHRSCYFSICAILLSLGCGSDAKPALLISSSTPKCLKADVPQGTRLQVNVEAFGKFFISLDFMKQTTISCQFLTNQRLYSNVVLDLPAESSETETYVTVQQLGISDPKVRTITSPKLTVDFTAYKSGEVQACIYASTASAKNAQTFTLELNAVTLNEMYTSPDYQENLSNHISKLEHSVQILQNELSIILKDADYSKEQFAVYAQEKYDMYLEAGRWPILHIIVLVLAGFMQAQHIVSFFKKKHLI